MANENSKLEKLYLTLDYLTENSFSVDDNMMKEMAALERQDIERCITETLAPMLASMRCDHYIFITHIPGQTPSIEISSNINSMPAPSPVPTPVPAPAPTTTPIPHTEEDPAVPTHVAEDELSISDDEDEQLDPITPINRRGPQTHIRKRIATQILRITMPDGSVICHSKAADTFADCIVRIGLQTVRALNMTSCSIPLVSMRPDPNRNQTKRGSYYISTHSSTNTKAQLLREIAAELNIPLKVETILKGSEAVR